MGKRITLIDAGVGNLRSVQHALQSLGADVLRTERAEDVLAASSIVLPGVGAFGGFMHGLAQRGLIEPIRAAAQKGIPLLGICVGMQALFDLGLEMGEFEGLGLLRGRVVRFTDTPGLKIPHTGWNQFHAVKSHALVAGLLNDPYTYFNHAYFCQPNDPADILAETGYGMTFASAVQHDNLCGVQFHPEKSQATGLTFLNNFIQLK